MLKRNEIKAISYPNILVTENFCTNVGDIYDKFTDTDDEYPAMGVTIENAPIFVECREYPPEAITRRRMTDEVQGDHPKVQVLWSETLRKYRGKCRYTSLHIHPMNLPYPSQVDISNYERVRLDDRVPNTFGIDAPIPFILINLNNGCLDILGFWVFEEHCYEAEIEKVNDDDIRVTEAWSKACPLSYFSKEADCVNSINKQIDSSWEVTLGEKKGTDDKVILVKRNDTRIIMKFNNSSALGLDLDGDLLLENYVDWCRLFTDIEKQSSVSTLNELENTKKEVVKTSHPSVLKKNKKRWVF